VKRPCRFDKLFSATPTATWSRARRRVDVATYRGGGAADTNPTALWEQM